MVCEINSYLQTAEFFLAAGGRWPGTRQAGAGLIRLPGPRAHDRLGPVGPLTGGATGPILPDMVRGSNGLSGCLP